MIVLSNYDWVNYLYFILVLIAVFSAVKILQKRKWLKEFGNYFQMRALGRPRTILSEFFEAFLILVFAGIMGLVISGPKWKTTEMYEEKEPLLFSIWLDNSLSTLARDVVVAGKEGSRKISRKEMALGEIKNFVEKLEIDQVGLGVFADGAYVVLPLLPIQSPFFRRTFFEELERISDLDPNLMVQGTNIGLTIWVALEEIAKGDERCGKVIIILTDGEQQGKEEELGEHLAKALKYFLEKDVSIYLVGIGDPGKTSLIPKKAVLEGELVEYMTLPNGDFIRTKPDFVLLREIAARSGGKFIPATSGKELEGAIVEIVKERRVIQKKERIVYYDIWQHLLFLALVILFFLNPKRELI